MACSTRSRVSARTASEPLATREAVATLTPACFATSRRPGMFAFVTRFTLAGNG